MILIILFVATILRFISINQSLWLDEAINVNNAAGLSFKELIFNYSLGDFHPPLYHILLRSWILFFGSSEISVRIPSIILSIVGVYFIYLIAKKLFENKTALVAATLVATAPLHIYYSQEARMYMLACTLGAASVYFFIALIKNDKLKYWIGFIIATSLMLYSDYLPYLLIPTFVIYLFFNRKHIPKSTLRAFIPAFILIFILLTPWLVIFPSQLSTGLSAAAASPAWAQVVGTPDFKNLVLVFVKFTVGRISHDNNLIYALSFAPVAAFSIFLLLLSLFRSSYLRSFIYYWLFPPVILGFLIAFFVPIFSYFRFLFVLPAYYIIWASSINTINWTPLMRFLLGVALLINLTSVIIYFTDPKFQREDWRSATAYVKESANESSLVLFESNLTVGPFDYYNIGDLQAIGALADFSATPPKVREDLNLYISDKNKIYLFQYLSQITDPGGLVFEELTKLGFKNTATRDFIGVGFIYEFKK